MFLQRKEPWTTLALASAVLGLALYYLRTLRPSPATTTEQRPESDQPRQEESVHHVSNADKMNGDERAFHERFMREAIAMVNQPLHNLHSQTT